MKFLGNNCLLRVRFQSRTLRCQERRELQLLRGRRDSITEANVDLDGNLGFPEKYLHPDANAAMLLIFADLHGS